MALAACALAGFVGPYAHEPYGDVYSTAVHVVAAPVVTPILKRRVAMFRSHRKDYHRNTHW